ERRQPGEAGGIPRAHGVEGARSAPRLPVRGAQLDLPPRRAPEALVAHHPGARHLRVDLQAEALAERAVAVHAQAGGDEVLVRDVEHVLQEEAGVPDLLPALAGTLERARADRGVDRAGEVLALALDVVLVVADGLSAPGEAR